MPPFKTWQNNNDWRTEGQLWNPGDFNYEMETIVENPVMAIDELHLANALGEDFPISSSVRALNLISGIHPTWKLQDGNVAGWNTTGGTIQLRPDGRLDINLGGDQGRHFNLRAELTGAFQVELWSTWVSNVLFSVGGGLFAYVDANNWYYIYHERALTRLRITRNIGGFPSGTVINLPSQKTYMDWRFNRDVSGNVNIQYRYEGGVWTTAISSEAFTTSDVWVGIRQHTGTNPASACRMRYEQIQLNSGGYKTVGYPPGGAYRLIGRWRTTTLQHGVDFTKLGKVVLHSSNVNPTAHPTGVKVLNPAGTIVLADIISPFTTPGSKEYDFTPYNIQEDCIIQLGGGSNTNVGFSLTKMEAFEAEAPVSLVGAPFYIGGR